MNLFSYKSTLQHIKILHLYAPNTTILHLNILQVPKALTWPSSQHPNVEFLFKILSS